MEQQLFKNFSVTFLGMALGIAAGSFIYIAASELIPEIHRKFNRVNAIVVLLGIIFMLLITRVF